VSEPAEFAGPLPRITIDTNVAIRPHREALELARRLGFDVAVTSVSPRELPPTSEGRRTVAPLDVVLETAVFDESEFDNAVWGGDGDDSALEEVLATINPAFPAPANRANLSKGYRGQLRDSMIFSAHVREHRDIFVTSNTSDFVAGDRRERLEAAFRTKIMTPAEFVAALRPAGGRAEVQRIQGQLDMASDDPYRETTMIKDPAVLAEIRADWGEVRAMRGRLAGTTLAAHAFSDGGNLAISRLGNVVHNLPFLLASEVLKRAVRQLRNENAFSAGSSDNMVKLMDAARSQLSWRDWQALRDGVDRRNEIAHDGTLHDRATCDRHMDAIEAQLVAWGIVDPPH
jgi:hypothetical protein